MMTNPASPPIIVTSLKNKSGAGSSYMQHAGGGHNRAIQYFRENQVQPDLSWIRFSLRVESPLLNSSL